MKTKTLTICIAAYNAEEYISNAVNSCLIEDYINDIEVLIIDDGSNDKTGIIADKYSEKYKGTVSVIHKKNGGYGSAVNEGMKKASGKYFKLLDADDWFDRNGFVSLLRICQQSDSDVILTKVLIEDYKTKRQKIIGEWSNSKHFKTQLRNVEVKNPSMHTMAVRTELLKNDVEFSLPERIHYTDNLFSLHVMAIAETVELLPYAVYIYSMGRSEQSMSSQNLKKNVSEIEKVFEIAVDYYVKLPKEKQEEKIIKGEIRVIYSTLIECLMHLKKSKNNLLKILDKEKFIKSIDRELSDYIEKNTRKVGFLRHTYYFGYWIAAGRIMDIIHPM